MTGTRRLLALLMLSMLGCAASAAEPPPEPVPTGPRFPPITRGAVPPNDEIAAARLMAEARRAFDAADFGAAVATARELAAQYPTTPGAAEALWILGRASIEVGDHAGAALATSSLLEVLEGTHPLVPDAHRLRAEALFRAGDLRAATEAFVDLPDALVSDTIVSRIEVAVAELDQVDLRALADRAADDGADPRFGPVLAELALSLALSGETREAREVALRAQRLGPTGRAEQVVTAVLAGDVSAFVPAVPVIGAVLPVTGSPSNQEYAQLFLEGVEVALERARREGVNVELVVEDNRGTSTGSERGITALEARGAVAVLGPLLEEHVMAASLVRSRDLALFSPTARRIPDGSGGVYSMAAGDPGAARTLALAVSDLGYADAVVLHPGTPSGVQEAVTFEEAFLATGGDVRRRLEYEPGTTYFEEPLMEVATLLPELLVMAAPADDLELLAPQVAFFGLDTLDIQVAGTAGWTAPSVIDAVAQRHTDRVIAVSSAPPGATTDLATEFVEAYESRYRKTLRSLVPAMGFDLFRMVLEAYGAGVRTSGDLIASLDGVRQFEGVTGTYSVVNGRIAREYFPVKIFEGSLVPVDTELPEIVRPNPGGR